MDKYVYPNTNVLKNKLNIKEQGKLTEIERRSTSARYMELENKKVLLKKTFDFEHLKKIHNHLFKDIYSWAGKVRDVDIAKGNSLFCRAVHIKGYAEDIFKKIKKEDFFKGKNKEELSLKLAETLLDLNALHPFREGNGRAQREFIRELAEERGYKLSFEHFTQKENIELSDLTLKPQKLADKLIEGMEVIKEKDVVSIVKNYPDSCNAITGSIYVTENKKDILKEKTKDKDFSTNAYIDIKNIKKLKIEINQDEKSYKVDCFTVKNNKILKSSIEVYNIEQLVITKEIEKHFKEPQKKERIEEVSKEKSIDKGIER